MNDIDIDEFILEHFGTKGMQWGVRKSPKEVRAKEKATQAKREVKAKKYEAKAKKIQGEIDKLTPYDYRVADLKYAKKTAIDDAQRKREGKLSKAQKQVVVGASIVAALAVTYAAYSTVQSGNGRRLAEKGKDHILKRKGLPWKLKPELKNPDLDADGIMAHVVKPINPKYGQPGTKMNCRRATYAYEMRRRGYDVSATRTTNARGQDISGTFNAANPGKNNVAPGRLGILTRIVSESRKSEKPFTEAVNKSQDGKFSGVAHSLNLRNSLSKQPDGARGEIAVFRKLGGGHSVAWEKIKGELVVFDNQTGKKYHGSEISDFLGDFDSSTFSRLDNIPLNDDFLRRWLKHA